jgi:transketolase
MNRNKLVSKIIKLAYKSKEGHVPSSLSILDILYTIYNDKITKSNSNKFVLSKGHASLGLYVILDHFGILEDDLESFCSFDSLLGGHPTLKIKGVEASTGSLGHGMPIAVGMAMSKKIKNEDGDIFVLIGDGEANEGTIWESALLANHHNLNNLYCLIDYNHSTDRAIAYKDISAQFNSFGWDSMSIDGHDENQIKSAINTKRNKPMCIVCNTVKGKGCRLMENNPEWHHKTPTEQQIVEILQEIEG